MIVVVLKKEKKCRTMMLMWDMVLQMMRNGIKFIESSPVRFTHREWIVLIRLLDNKNFDVLVHLVFAVPWDDEVQHH